MFHNIILVSTISLFLLATTSAKAEPPTIDELKDPWNKSYGLHLDRVDIREKALRKQGVANDISTKVRLFRSQKALVKKLIADMLTFKETIRKKEGKTSPRKSTREKLKADIKALEEKVNVIKLRIAGYNLVQKSLGDKIMEQLDLNPTQLAQIPPLSAK